MTRFLSQLLRKYHFLMCVIAMFLGFSTVHAQSSFHGDVGVGGGLSYGGFGTHLSYRPFEKLGVFGSLGYNLDGLGYNVGLKYLLTSPKKLSPYLTGMYGYNTVLLVETLTMESKTTYFGFSTGVGVEFRLNEKSFLSTEVLVPFRPQAYNDAVNDLQSIGYEIKDLLPVTFCIGYHFKF